MISFELLPEAAAEIEAAVDFHNENWGTGDELRDTIEATIERICRLPKIGREHNRGTRKLVVPGFLYHSVVYLPTPDRILVVAVPHSSCSPEYWLNRLDDKSED